mmetsp:Transcript_18566/g.53165  ORF Transcript_18566/g.53165 Transcript_18566/m.53165 type:complete len:382 (+) Transcript_18566:71-1216(+)
MHPLGRMRRQIAVWARAKGARTAVPAALWQPPPHGSARRSRRRPRSPERLRGLQALIAELCVHLAVRVHGDVEGAHLARLELLRERPTKRAALEFAQPTLVRDHSDDGVLDRGQERGEAGGTPAQHGSVLDLFVVIVVVFSEVLEKHLWARQWAGHTARCAGPRRRRRSLAARGHGNGWAPVEVEAGEGGGDIAAVGSNPVAGVAGAAFAKNIADTDIRMLREERVRRLQGSEEGRHQNGRGLGELGSFERLACSGRLPAPGCAELGVFEAGVGQRLTARTLQSGVELLRALHKPHSQGLGAGLRLRVVLDDVVHCLPVPYEVHGLSGQHLAANDLRFSIRGRGQFIGIQEHGADGQLACRNLRAGAHGEGARRKQQVGGP